MDRDLVRVHNQLLFRGIDLRVCPLDRIERGFGGESPEIGTAISFRVLGESILEFVRNTPVLGVNVDD